MFKIFKIKKNTIRKTVKILKDKNGQCSIKIPKEFSNDLNINKETDRFQFEMEVLNENNVKLKGELIRNGN